jgi:hypothetical protein
MLAQYTHTLDLRKWVGTYGNVRFKLPLIMTSGESPNLRVHMKALSSGNMKKGNVRHFKALQMSNFSPSVIRLTDSTFDNLVRAGFGADYSNVVFDRRLTKRQILPNQHSNPNTAEIESI